MLFPVPLIRKKSLPLTLGEIVTAITGALPHRCAIVFGAASQLNLIEGVFAEVFTVNVTVLSQSGPHLADGSGCRRCADGENACHRYKKSHNAKNGNESFGNGFFHGVIPFFRKKYCYWICPSPYDGTSFLIRRRKERMGD